MKTLKQIREASGGKEAYQKFFNSLLKKFGVDSPSELTGDKKKKFFNAVDKGWEGDDPNDANEATIHLSNTQLTEKLKPGKGSLTGKDAIGADVDWDNVGDEKKWIKQAKSKYKVTIKKDVGKYHSGMSISGKKADIIKFLQGPMYGGVDDRDIEDMWPWLLENKDDFKDDTDVSDDEGNYSGVDEEHEDDESPKKKVGDDEGNYSGVEEDIYGRAEYYKRVDKVNAKWGIGPAAKSLSDLKPNEIKKYFKDYDKAVKEMNEKAPPGMESKVKELKKDHSDEEAFAIAWSIHNKKNEAVKIGKSIKGKLGKTYPVMNMSQKKKIIAIAKKHSGDMQRAMKEIDKIRKNLTDNPDVMDILKKANEAVAEGVGVDNRTLGFKAAVLRREKAKKVREKSKLKKEKKKEQAVLDARYEYDGEVDTVLANANKALFGETGANAVAHGGVDMAPNAGKKEKKSKVIKRYNY